MRNSYSVKISYRPEEITYDCARADLDVLVIADSFNQAAQTALELLHVEKRLHCEVQGVDLMSVYSD